MVMEVAQVLDALAVQPLPLVNDKQPLAPGEQADQLLGELEPVRTPGIGADRFSSTRAHGLPSRAPGRDRARGAFSVAMPGVCFRETSLL
jgi:hypothetical protein